MRRISLAMERRFIHPVSIQRKLRVDTAMGGYTEEWATVQRVNGFFRPLSGQEIVEAAQRKLTSTHRFTAPYSECTNLDRLVYNGKAYPITYIHDTMNAQRMMQVDVDFTTGEQIEEQERQAALVDIPVANLVQYYAEAPEFRLGVQSRFTAEAATLNVLAEAPTLKLITQVYLEVGEEAYLLHEATTPVIELGTPTYTNVPAAHFDAVGHGVDLYLSRSAYLDAFDAGMQVLASAMDVGSTLSTSITPEAAIVSHEMLQQAVHAIKTSTVQATVGEVLPIYAIAPITQVIQSRFIQAVSAAASNESEMVTVHTSLGVVASPESATVTMNTEVPDIDIWMPLNITVDLSTLALYQLPTAQMPLQNSDYAASGMGGPEIQIIPKKVAYAATIIYDEDHALSGDISTTTANSIPISLASILSELDQTGSGAPVNYVRVLSTQQAMNLTDAELNDTKFFVLHSSIEDPGYLATDAPQSRFTALGNRIWLPVFSMNYRITSRFLGVNTGLNTPIWQSPSAQYPQLNVLSTGSHVGNILDFIQPLTAGGDLYRIGIYNSAISAASLPNGTSNRLYMHYAEENTYTGTATVLRAQLPLGNRGNFVTRHYDASTGHDYGISVPFMKAIFPANATGEKLAVRNIQKGIIKDLIVRSPKGAYAVEARG